MPRPSTGQTLPTLLASITPTSSPILASAASSSSTRPPLVLIRPESFPPTSFYRITRSALKFRPAAYVSARATGANPAKYVGTSGGSGAGKDVKMKPPVGSYGEGFEGDVEGVMGELKASGRVYGQLFWEGKYVAPTSPLSKPDPRIHGGSKPKWVAVDPSTLSEEIRSAVYSAPLSEATKGRKPRRSWSATPAERTAT